MIVAYTDGSSRGGPAGWAVLIEGELYSDWLAYATNNEAELYAVLQAVMLCPAWEQLLIRTDSKLAIGWLSLGWRIRKQHNLGLVKVYFDVCHAKDLTVRFEHVHGHSGDPRNEKVDRAAHAQAGIALALQE